MYKHEKNSGREEKLILANPILADPHYPVRHAPSKFSAFIIFSRSKTTFPFKNQVICFFVVEVFPFRVSITHLVGAVFVGNVATSPPGGGGGGEGSDFPIFSAATHNDRTKSRKATRRKLRLKIQSLVRILNEKDNFETSFR